MTTLIVCLFIAMIIPYLAKIPVGYAMQKTGHYDNNYPRVQQSSLQGFGARAAAAHQNAFEALLLFSCAVLTALATHNFSTTIERLAIAFIILRVVYHVIYLLNWATLRSTIWFASLICCLSIVWMCIP
ncbi:MAG: MAPEG family protein [Legionella sp.]